MDINADPYFAANTNAYLSGLQAAHDADMTHMWHILEFVGVTTLLSLWGQRRQNRAFAASPEGIAQRVAQEYGL